MTRSVDREYENIIIRGLRRVSWDLSEMLIGINNIAPIIHLTTRRYVSGA